MTYRTPRLDVLRILWMRIFKELLLRRDFLQHSARFLGLEYRTTEERQKHTSKCLGGTSVNCVSSGLQLSICLPSSFLLFFPVLRGTSFGGGALEGGEEAASECARSARGGVSQLKPRDLLSGRQPLFRGPTERLTT